MPPRGSRGQRGGSRRRGKAHAPPSEEAGRGGPRQAAPGDGGATPEAGGAPGAPRGRWQGIERRTREAAGLADPAQRARALLALQRHADEGWTWEEDWNAGWNRRVDAFTVVSEALAHAGPAAVDAILAGDAPPGSWYAGAAAMALHDLTAVGDAGGREEAVLEWLLRNARDQNQAYADATALVVDRMGAASVPTLERFARGEGDEIVAMVIVHDLLGGADPEWADAAAEGMLRRLAEGGTGLARSLGPAAALLSLRGPAAAPAIKDALARAEGGAGGEDDRARARMVAKLERVLSSIDGDDGLLEGDGGPFDGDGDLLGGDEGLLGGDEGLFGGDGDLLDGDEGLFGGDGGLLDGDEVDDIAAWDDCFGPDAGPLPCAGGDGVCPEDCPISDPFLLQEDIDAIPRYLLARACAALGLDAGGPKRGLLGRLWEHHERMLGLVVDPVPREELLGMRPGELREMCEDLGLDEGGRKAELVGRLDRFFREEGRPAEPVETFSRGELDAMTSRHLRTVCQDMGLDAGGKRAALVARVLSAQEERLR